ncbi:DUF4166 domain-containing protein [Curtobacterium sp. NPDC087082]|uniref:DUF4166 domain-containing protein n=1 Tax=Curtobacterium sp. NPDC087082 TaxID=3363966 RepID=UPI0038121EB1
MVRPRRRHVPVWERDVPFTVENRPARVGRGQAVQEGRVAVRAHRTFRFRSGTCTMVDAITAGPDGLVDHLGRRGRVSALLRAEVDAQGPDAGALRLVRTRASDPDSQARPAHPAQRWRVAAERGA